MHNLTKSFAAFLLVTGCASAPKPIYSIDPNKALEMQKQLDAKEAKIQRLAADKERLRKDMWAEMHHDWDKISDEEKAAFAKRYVPAPVVQAPVPAPTVLRRLPHAPLPMDPYYGQAPVAPIPAYSRRPAAPAFMAPPVPPAFMGPIVSPMVCAWNSPPPGWYGRPMDQFSIFVNAVSSNTYFVLEIAGRHPTFVGFTPQQVVTLHGMVQRVAAFQSGVINCLTNQPGGTTVEHAFTFVKMTRTIAQPAPGLPPRPMLLEACTGTVFKTDMTGSAKFNVWGNQPCDHLTGY